MCLPITTFGTQLRDLITYGSESIELCEKFWTQVRDVINSGTECIAGKGFEHFSRSDSFGPKP